METYTYHRKFRRNKREVDNINRIPNIQYSLHAINVTKSLIKTSIKH